MVGSPTPILEWMKTTDSVRDSAGVGGRVGLAGGGGKEQILPGGDLHVAGNNAQSRLVTNARRW